MTNVINNTKDVGSIISKMAAGMLEDEFQFIKSIDKESASSFGQTNGYNAGDTINISKPARFEMNSGADISSAIQDVVEEKVPLVLDKQRNIAINLTSAEIATDLSLKSWANRILRPAMSRLAQGIESECLELAQDAVYNTIGDADGTTVYDTATMLAGRTKLRENLAPMGDKECALLNSSAMASAVTARNGLFQSSDQIASQYKNGYMGIADGFTYLENNLLPTHTNGSDVTGIAINDAAVAEGVSTITVDGASAAPEVGSVFTIAGVNSVHPITKIDTGNLQQFVVTSATTTVLGISPSLYAGSAGLQNVTALPADDAALVFVGAASSAIKNNLLYNKDAFRFVSVPLVTPSGTDLASSSTVNDITVRAIRDYTISSDKLTMRLDVLYGFAAVRPEWACRIAN